jgi:hypothetical protein
VTNHPRRQRGDDAPSAAGDLAAEVPAVKELSDEMAAQPPQQVPPGFGANGRTPSAQALRAVAAALEQLPQQLFQAVVQALSQVQVSVKPLPCATCMLARYTWFSMHARELAEAEAAYKAAVEALPGDDPRRGLIQALSFLPASLQPSPDPASPNPEAMPGLAESAVMVGGTLYCAAHHPGAQQQPGRKPFLIAQGALSAQMLAEMRGSAA